MKKLALLQTSVLIILVSNMIGTTKKLEANRGIKREKIHARADNQTEVNNQEGMSRKDLNTQEIAERYDDDVKIKAAQEANDGEED